jgi:hypothetical protein
MREELEKLIAELVEVAEKCPESYRTTCFRVLLEYYLSRMRKPASSEAVAVMPTEVTDVKAASSDDTRIRLNDIHIKARRFLEKSGLDEDQLNNIYFREGDDFLPVFDDLKTVKAAETQIRVSLLQAFVRSMGDGDFSFDGEAVRSECQERKAYDLPNFTKNFRNNASLFDGFEKYKKSEPIRLSQEGKDRLAVLLRELAE